MKLFNVLQTVFLSCGLVQATAQTTAWQPQPVPLSSRWSKTVNPQKVWAEYPRPNMQRTGWMNLNGLWEYAITDDKADNMGSSNGKILVPFPVESSLSGVRKSLMPNQLLWYKRNFNAPARKSEERVLLHFEAVDWKMNVMVNGQAAGEHTGGYDHFSFDITDLLKAGKNELIVKVEDPTDKGINPHGKQTLNPGNIYYTPSSGIWQTVWLEVVPSTYLENLVITPDLDSKTVTVKANSINAINNDQVEVTALSAGKVVATGKGSVLNKISLSVPNVHLWSPENPFLYDLNVKITRNGKVIDQVSSYFGMRKVVVQKDEKGYPRIFLNNKYVYNLGVLDQGFWPDGLMTAPSDEALAFDIKAIKNMGFNTIRKHIKVEPARWYYHADRLGMLVWQDFVNPPHRLPEGAKAVFEHESKITMDQLHNYPSIITWVLFNERWGAYDQKRLTEWVKNYDPTRLINGHTGELLYVGGKLREPSKEPWVSSELADLHAYPDPMEFPVAIKEGQVKIIGEFGGVGVPVSGHEWDDIKKWGYVETKPAELVIKFEAMTKQLKELEATGLAGSIYTQPFDVETEENGLMTYDREVVKIPVKKIREINSILVKSSVPAYAPTFNMGKDLDLKDNDDQYPFLVRSFKSGKRDSVFLRRLTLMSIRKKDQAMTTEANNAFIAQMKAPYSKDNLNFIKQTTFTTKDKGVEMAKNNAARIDAVLGARSAAGIMNAVLDQSVIKPWLVKNASNPDWQSFRTSLVKEYGDVVFEFVSGEALGYYWGKKDWPNFGKFYADYFRTATPHSKFHINNASWQVFETITDQKVLEVAIEASRYNIEHFELNNGGSIDTYANLLYKAGRKVEAIEWEEKAVKLEPDARELVETLEKMKKGDPTWPLN